MKKITLISLLIFFAFLILPKNIFAQTQNTFPAEVIEIIDDGEGFQTLRAKDNYSYEYVIENGNAELSVTQKFSVGNNIIVSEIENINGTTNYIVVDYYRNDGLLILFIIFVVLVILIGGFYGALSIVGMAFSFLIIFYMILPMILSGWNAVLSAILGSCLIIPATFSLSHGLKRKTIIAMVSTIITITITGIIALLFVETAHLTGFAAEESAFLLNIVGEKLNFKGILLAGIIIATLGVLDDITISQASIVEELKSANKKLTKNEIFKKAMNVGRDHISSLVNTLILVYTGASLPLLLLFTNSGLGFSEAINYEIIAEEVVRTLVGSIGLVLAVPITTAIAVYYSFDKAKK